MKQAWPLRSRPFCLSDFVGHNPMLAINVDNKNLFDKLEFSAIAFP